MNGTGADRLEVELARVGAFVGSTHIFLSAVGDGIMPASADSMYGNDVHGSVSVNFSVSLSTTTMSLISAM